MEARKFFSRIGWIFVIFILYTTALQLVLSVALGVFAPWLPEWAVSDNALLLYVQLTMYVFGFPVFVLMMHRIPSCKMDMPKKMGAKRFFLILIFCFGATYLGNLVGSALMGISGYFAGVENVNPLDEVMSGMSIWMITLTTVVIAPVMEELMFRKYLVDRLVPYGQKTAVILSGVLFGLFHGNFYQFFYATALGMIFAYIYSSTGRIRYNIILHMLINIVGGVVSMLLVRGMDQGSAAAYMGMRILGLWMIISVIAAVVLLCLYVHKLTWFPGWLRSEKGVARAVLTAPGMWGMLAVSILMFLISG